VFPTVPRTIQPEPEALPGLINGQVAASSYEWRVAVALWKYKWEFDYQIGIFGGRAQRGGIVLDFLVHTLPLSTPTFVQGEYWHNPRSERDYLQKVLLIAAYKGKIAEPVFLWGPELHTQESTDAYIFRTFGRSS